MLTIADLKAEGYTCVNPHLPDRMQQWAKTLPSGHIVQLPFRPQKSRQLATEFDGRKGLFVYYIETIADLRNAGTEACFRVDIANTDVGRLLNKLAGA